MRAFVRVLARWRRDSWIAAVALVVLASSLGALKGLAYSRASLRAIDLDEAASTARPLDLDGLSWDPAIYQSAPQLEAIRADVRQHCPGRGGYDTAACLMNLFARRFPHDSPGREFFEHDYSPAAIWKAHLAGAPGHCVSRSSMLATGLLASGIPARVVQVISRYRNEGHNVAEVWQAEGGWRIFDPSFAGRLQARDGRTSAVGLITAPYPRWTHDPTRAKVPGLEESQALTAYAETSLREAVIVYPEPWLYTRVGQSQASFPMRGRFLIVGPLSWKIGLGQPILQAAILASLLALGLVAVKRLRRPLRRRSVHVVEQGFAPRQELTDF